MNISKEIPVAMEINAGIDMKKSLYGHSTQCVTRQFRKLMFILDDGSEREERECNWWIEGLHKWHETLTPCEHTEH